MNMYSSSHVSNGDVQVNANIADADAVADVQSHWMDRFSLATKLNASVICSCAIMVFMVALLTWTAIYYSSSGRHVADVAGLEVRTTHTVMELDEAHFAVRDRLDRDVENSLATVAGDIASARENIVYTQSWISDQMPSETHATVAKFVGDVEALEREWDRIGPDASRAELESFEADLAGTRAEIAAYAMELRGTLAPAARDLFNGLDNNILMNLVVIAIALVVGALLARTINRTVVGVISGITDAMNRIAKGEMDTIIPGGTRQDEIGDMARSLEVFRTDSLKLRDLTETHAREVETQLEAQQKIADEVAGLRREKSRLLEEMANEFEVSVGEVITAVSAASMQLKATSKQMVALADGSNDQARDATAAMESATANVTAAAAATDEFALSISEISRQASSSAQLARGASELVDSANTRMSHLSVAADEIGEIAGLIQTIAQRTNLLALNASIEAARGGEAGRGFAVVASEVKELAMQTSNATASVAEKIQAMQDSTRSSASDLTSIVQQIGELEQAAVMIASAVDQQSVSGEELARNIDTVASGSAKVGERLKSLRSASEETGSAADDVVQSATALGDHADNLRDKAGRFIEDVRRSARELEADEAA